LGDPRWSLSSSPPTAETPDSRLQRGSTRLPTTPTRPSSLASTTQQPREADRERPRKTDSFHSTLSTRRLSTRRLPLASLHAAFSARFYFHGASPLPSRRVGEEFVAVAPKGRRRRGHLPPKIRPPLNINFDPWLEPHLPRPAARESKEGGKGKSQALSELLLFLHGRDGF